jgi:CheY-like chemotaxis protein
LSEECCNPKILIVDDNEMNILAVSSILKSINPSLNIVEACNGKIAVEKY